MLTNLSLIIAAAAISLLGLMVFLTNTRAKANRLFFGFILSVVAWMVANLMTNISADPQAALGWARSTAIGGTLLVFFFYLFVCNFPRPRRQSGRRLALLSALPVLLVITAPTALNIASSTAYGTSIEPGPLYSVLTAVLVGYTAAALVELIRRFRRTSGREHQQVRFVLFGLLVSFLPGLLLNAVLPLVGYPQYAALGPFVVVAFVAIVSYAMARHQLLDVRLVVARSVAYVLLLATMAGLYAAAAFGLGGALFGTQQVSLQFQLLNVALALVLAFTFQPLRRFFERLTDKVFYHDRYDPQEVLRGVGQILAYEFRLGQMLEQSLALLCRQLRVAGGQFVIIEKGKIYHRATRNSNIHVRSADVAKLGRNLVAADETSGARAAILRRYGFRVSVPLRTKGDTTGYLLLGEKRSGAVYSQQDLGLLKILGNELAVGVTNAKAYEEIARFAETLQGRVDEATARLRVANRNLKALDKSKDEFISMASHQLRTPLTVIKGYLSMLVEGDAGKLPAKQREFVDPAYAQTQRMVHLISDLLNVSRMSSGKFMIDRHPTDLIEVARQETEQLSEAARSKGLRLTFVPPRRKVPALSVDEGKLRQVMMNFIDNAIYYTNSGGITVSVTKAGSEAEFRVRDTGIGVPKAAQKKLFSKFFRADNAKTNRPEGTGLGLFMARRVIEDHGGRLIFESEEGQGSTFGFALPLK